MQAVIGALRANLGLDTAQFDKGLKDAKGALSNFGDGMISAGSKMTAGITAPMAAAAAGAFALANSVANTGNEIAKGAREAGISAQSFQELGFAIGQISRVSDNEAQKALNRLSTTIGDVKNGNESAAASFEALGISAEDIRSGALTNEQVFNQIITNLEGMEDQALATALAGDLLSDRVAQKLVPALVGNAGQVDELRERYRELGLGMSDDALGASEEFIDKMDELTRQFQQVGLEIGSALIPLFNELIPVIQDNVVPAIRSMTQFVVDAIKWFRELPGPVQQAAGLIAAALGAAGPVVMAIGVVSKVIAALIAATGPIGLLIVAITTVVAVWQNWDTIGPILENLYNVAKQWLQDALGGVLEWVGDRIRDVGNAFAWLYEVVVGNSYVPDMVDEIGIQFGRLQSEMVVPAEQATNQTAAHFENMADRSVSAAEEMGEKISSAMDSVINAVSGLLGDLLSGAEITFADIGKLAGDLAKQLFVNPFMSGLKGGISSLFSGFFADGGVIEPGRWGIVGEAGPEIVEGGRHGATVTPMRDARGGGDVTQIFNVTAPDPNAFRYSQRQLLRQARQGLGE